MRRLPILPTLSAALALIGALTIALVLPGSAAAQTAAQPTPNELIYFADTAPFRANLGKNQQWLDAIVNALVTGQRADEVTTDEIANLSREIYAAHRGFGQASPSARLEMYDRNIKLSLDRAYTASVLLLKAQVTESGPMHDDLVRDAATYAASSGKLLKDADAALRETALAAAVQ